MGPESCFRNFELTARYFGSVVLRDATQGGNATIKNK